MEHTMDDGTFRLTGRHVLWSVIAFFGVIFAVNGYFLYAALSTYSGVVSHEPYVKGLHYNERIADDAVQQSRHWAVKVDVPASRDKLTVAIDDPAMKPVTGIAFQGYVGRAASDKTDMKVDLVEEAPGRYAVKLPRLADGAWLIKLDGTLPDAKAGEPPFRLRQRVWLAP